jgi:hypothetical protein
MPMPDDPHQSGPADIEHRQGRYQTEGGFWWGDQSSGWRNQRTAKSEIVRVLL